MNAIALLRLGGIVMWPLMVASVLIWVLMAERWLFLKREGHLRPGLAATLAHLYRTEGKHDCLGLLQREKGAFAEMLKGLFQETGNPPSRSRLDRCVHEAIVGLSWSGSLLHALVQAAPLLGLLGTVLGMIETFTVLQAMGTEEPGALAGGISQALLTTEAGLMIALPGLFGESRLRRREKWLRLEIERARLILGQALE